jgi:hypothetical protein
MLTGKDEPETGKSAKAQVLQKISFYFIGL